MLEDGDSHRRNAGALVHRTKTGQPASTTHLQNQESKPDSPWEAVLQANSGQQPVDEPKAAGKPGASHSPTYEPCCLGACGFC